jgi:hypothetical protein
MKAQRIALWAAVTICGGVCLLYAGANVAAHWASFATSQRHFGLNRDVMLAVDDYFVWGLVALVIGAVVGAILRSRPVLAGTLTSVASGIAFLIDGSQAGITIRDSIGLFSEPMLASLVFTAAGAFLAVRVLRPNKSLERKRES